MKILSSCSYPPGQWCNCEHGWILGFPFSPSLWPVLFLLPWEEQVQRCHHVLYTNKQYSCWLLLVCGKAFYCCAHAVHEKWVLGTMGAPYNGWARTCCSLAMAGACAKHRPCYWSQTRTSWCVLVQNRRRMWNSIISKCFLLRKAVRWKWIYDYVFNFQKETMLICMTFHQAFLFLIK